MKPRTTILILILAGLCSCITAWTQERNVADPRNVEEQARSYFLQARQGAP